MSKKFIYTIILFFISFIFSSESPNSLSRNDSHPLSILLAFVLSPVVYYLALALVKKIYIYIYPETWHGFVLLSCCFDLVVSNPVPNKRSNSNANVSFVFDVCDVIHQCVIILPFTFLPTHCCNVNHVNFCQQPTLMICLTCSDHGKLSAVIEDWYMCSQCTFRAKILVVVQVQRWSLSVFVFFVAALMILAVVLN